MMKLLIGLMLLLVSGAASAEWTVVGPNEEINQYVDKATIRRNGNFVKMWDLVDYKKAQVFGGTSDLSYRSLVEYDCKEKRYRSLALTTYSGQMLSGTVNFIGNDTQKWKAVASGSMAETLRKIACGKE